MKRIFFSLLILLMAMAGMQARTFVLVTGVSNYGDEANNLAQTTKDAKNFAKVMSTQTKDITLLTSSNVLLFRARDAGGNLRLRPSDSV